jgi:hypothetical protein
MTEKSIEYKFVLCIKSNDCADIAALSLTPLPTRSNGVSDLHPQVRCTPSLPPATCARARDHPRLVGGRRPLARSFLHVAGAESHKPGRFW